MTGRRSVLVTLVVLGTLVTAPVATAQVVGASTVSPSDSVDVPSAGTDGQAAGGAAPFDRPTTADRTPPEVHNRTYGGQYDDSADAVVRTDDGGLAFVGQTVSYSSHNGSLSIWLVKTGPDGTEAWNRSYGGSGYEEPVSVVQTDDGGFAIAGATTDGVGDRDIWLVKVAPDGTQEWTRTYGGGGIDSPYGLVATDDGGFAFLTTTERDGDLDAQLVKMGPDGTREWNRTYGGTGSDYGSALVKTDGGGFAIAGKSDSFGEGSAWLVETGPDGSEEWNRTYTAGAVEDLVRTEVGGYALTTRTGSGGDVTLIRTDSNGVEHWRRSYGGPRHDSVDTVVPTTDGGFAILGHAVGQFGDGYGYVDWLVKTAPDGDREWERRWNVSLGLNGQGLNDVVQASDGNFAAVGMIATDRGFQALFSKTYRNTTGDDCSGTDPGDDANTTRYGSLSGGADGDTRNFSVDPDAETVRLSLSGPDEADFDLYATTDGRTPTTGDYDRRSWSLGSEETIELDGEELGTSLGVLVDSYSGDGNYTLELAQIGRSGECKPESRTERGHLQRAGDGDTYRFGANATSEQFVVELNGTQPADFDLYATLDGREPTTSDYDLRSWSFDSQERIVVDADRIDGFAAVRVDSYQGAGNYTLTIRPTDDADAANGSTTGVGDWVEGCVPVFGACSADGS